MFVTTNVVFAWSAFGLTLACSVLAVLLVFSALCNRLRWPVLLGVVACLISVMGVTAWTPFGYFPEVGWTNGEISVRSGRLFYLPLALGGFVLSAAMWKRRRQMR